MKNLIISILKNTALSQRELAKNVGCSQSLLSLISTGKSKDVSYSLGCRIIDFAESRGIDTKAVLLKKGGKQ